MPSCAAVEPLATPPQTPTPAGRKSALAFFAVLLALFLPGLLAQGLQVVAGLLWTELFVFGLPGFVLASGSNLEPRAYLALRRVQPSLVGLGALVGAAGTILAVGVMMFAQRLLPPEWLRTFDVAKLFEGPLFERLALVAIATFVAPLCEELAFRGYLESTLLSRRRPGLAIGAAALLFATIHLDPVRFLALIALGAVFGWLRWRSGSVWPAVAAHATNNGLVSIVALVAPRLPRDDTPASLRDIAIAVGLGLAALLPLVGAFAAVAPPAGPPEALIVRRDPADPSLRFRWARVAPGLQLAVAGGAALLFAGLFAAVVIALLRRS